MKKIKVFLALAIILCMLVSSSHLSMAESSLGIDGPCYPIISPTNTSGVMTVTWWDAPDTEEGMVVYGTEPFTEGEVPRDARYAEGMIKREDTQNGYVVCSAEFTDLVNGATYYYRVGSADLWSDEHSFTVDFGAEKNAFLYLGDIQYSTYTEAEKDYERWGKLLDSAYRQNPQLGFGILGGDMVQQGQRSNDWQMFLVQASKVFDQLPMLAVPGNHESNSARSGKPELFLQLLSLPKNGPDGFSQEFYSYDYGNIHVVGLSSNIFSNEQLINGSMDEHDFQRIADWIERDLTQSDATWKVVVMHHPAYAVVSDAVAAKVLENWAPIFEQAQVDLVFCGHQHVYMRTKPMGGVTYVMGNSGSKHYAPNQVDYAEVMIADVSNYQIVETDGEYLTMTSYDADEVVLDSVRLKAKDRTIEPSWPEDLLGDLNGDGVVDERDLVLLLIAIQTNQGYQAMMDINGDGKVDICDAHRLALQIAGLL